VCRSPLIVRGSLDPVVDLLGPVIHAYEAVAQGEPQRAVRMHKVHLLVRSQPRVIQVLRCAATRIVKRGHQRAVIIPVRVVASQTAILVRQAEQAVHAIVIFLAATAKFSPGPEDPPTWTIVGVINDTKQRGLADEVTPEVTVSTSQWPRFMMTIVLRTSLDPASLVSSVRQQVSALDKNIPVYAVQTMDNLFSAEVASQRFNAGALAGFAGFAVLLAAVGIYGVMAYAVSQRTREMGVRIALGAARENVLRMILNQGFRLALIGVGLGLAASFALTRLMTGLLFGVKPSDPQTFILVTAALLAVALAACWIPAHRATRVNPVVALRHE
jgi:uncharacterized membrane protein YqjE